jgi:hypothetical protein
MVFKNSPLVVKDYIDPATGRVWLRTLYRNLKSTETINVGGKDRFRRRVIYLPSRHD